jgi:hypothetical protein
LIEFLKYAEFVDSLCVNRAESTSGRLVFIYVSDDMAAGRQRLANRNKERDLYFAGNGLVDDVDGIGRDLALLALCNHTIESHGSFSFFAGKQQLFFPFISYINLDPLCQF